MVRSTDGGRKQRGESDRSAEWWRPAIVAGAVLLASVVRIPGEAPADPGIVSLTDPFHLLGYAALASALVGPLDRSIRDRIGFRSAAISPSPAVRTLLAAVSAALLATAFGLGVEAVQAPIPWRSFALADALVNAAGALTGAGLAVAWRARR